MSFFDRVEIPFRKTIIVIEELPASVTPTVLEECEALRAKGVTEMKVNEHFILRHIGESVIENDRHLTDEEKSTLSDTRPRKWFNAAWEGINTLNGISGEAKDEKKEAIEKNSDEVAGNITSTSTDSAETLDSQV